jgi:SAM-dependent methyltransferase
VSAIRRRVPAWLKQLLKPRPLSTSRAGHRLRTFRQRGPLVGSVSTSPQLRAFTDELHLERQSIFEFVASCAQQLDSGSRVLDAGAGEAPYRELFEHCDYRTADWAKSVHPGARSADIIAPLDALPLADASFDAVLCTQVLEHVSDPVGVLGELLRVLRPGGHLWLTVPLTWPLHEEPFDFFRYTPYGLTSLLERAGFADIEIVPRNGYFVTMAQLLRLAGVAIGWPEDRYIGVRARLIEDLARLADQLERFDHLDEQRTFPLGYQVAARRPSGDI